MADLTHLDSAGLTAFVNGPVDTFVNDLKLMDGDDTNGGYPALKTIRDGVSVDQKEGMVWPLAIGNMAKDADSHVDGVNFGKAFSDNVAALITILDKQHTLFGDIADNLRTTIKDLLSAQGSNLTSVEGEPFLADFTDVDGDLSSGGGSTTT